MANYRTPRLSTQALVLASVLVAACGGGGTGSSTPAQSAARPAAARGASSAGAAQSEPTIDACALVTRAEAEQALGRTLLDPVKTGSAGMFSCEFGDPKHPIAKVLTVTVLVGTDAADAKNAMDLAKSNAAAGAVQDISGLGDAAYWDNAMHALTANKGRYQVEAFVDADAGLKAARAVVSSALVRLPN